MELTREILSDLAAPFDEREIEFKPGATAGDRALALAYIDARKVMNRLDAVVGPAGWSFTFDLLDSAGRMIRGNLTVLGVTKSDAGQAAGEDEPLKSAVSDSLKRAGVMFGIGRYLYELTPQWVAYDPQKKRLTEKPRLQPQPAGYDVRAGAARAMERTAVERGLGPAPITGGNGDEVKRHRLRLAAALKAINLDLDDARPIAGAVLNRPVDRMAMLSVEELEAVVAYVERDPRGADKIAALANEQTETLPMEVPEAVLKGHGQ